ncbi:esterase family protein, partial [Priestia megaterium]
MAFMQCDFFSEVLQIRPSMNVLIPQQTKCQIGLKTNTRSEKHPTLYLLHGLSDDHTIWMRRTSVERYA